MKASEHARLLELLSERLLADAPLELWRRVFLGPGYERIRFERDTLTFVGTDALDMDWTPTEIETLAARYGGRVERCGARATLVFADPHRALALALLLQRLGGGHVRTALVTASCNLACFEVDGEPRQLTLGGEARFAAATADRAPPGTIHVSAESYRVLGPALERQTRSALVTTELQDDVVTSAAITLPPSPRADLSTFAGLGLT